jgi:hypothetical protein
MQQSKQVAIWERGSGAQSVVDVLVSSYRKNPRPREGEGEGEGEGERSFTSERLQSWGGTLEAVRRRHRGHRRCQARFLVAPPLRPVRCAARLETTSWETMGLFG